MFFGVGRAHNLYQKSVKVLGWQAELELFKVYVSEFYWRHASKLLKLSTKSAMVSITTIQRDLSHGQFMICQ